MLKKSTRGFSALEMILVIAFVSIAFLSALRLLSGSVISSGELQTSIVAQNLANQKMEELMSESFVSLASEPLTPFTEFPDYSYTVSVATLGAHLKGIEVTIFWDTGGGSMDYMVDTILSDW